MINLNTQSEWEIWFRYLEVKHKTFNKSIKTRRRRKCRTLKPHRQEYNTDNLRNTGKNTSHLYLHFFQLNTIAITQTKIICPELCEIDNKHTKQKICELRGN